MINNKTGEKRIKKTNGKSAALSDWRCKDFYYGSDWKWAGTEPWKNICENVESIESGYYKLKGTKDKHL